MTVVAGREAAGMGQDETEKGDRGEAPREADEATAPDEVRAVFDDIRAVLRVPFVDQIWRMLALQPVVLAAVWLPYRWPLACPPTKRSEAT